MLNTGPTLVFCCSSSCRCCCSIPFSTKQRLYEQGDGMIMSLIFKAARLVNALIFMYTAESIGFALSHYSNKLWHNFHMNLQFYSLFFFFFKENISASFALAAQAGQRSGWSWHGFSVLLKDTWADWVNATAGPPAQQQCPATPTLTVDMNFKASVLHWIFLSSALVLRFS